MPVPVASDPMNAAVSPYRNRAAGFFRRLHAVIFEDHFTFTVRVAMLE